MRLTPLKKHSGGFSLVELAIVMAIIAVLLGTVLTGAASFLQRSRFADAETDLRRTKEAILGFAFSNNNNRLPCPDTDGDGLEDACGGGVAVGALPTRDLGLSGDDPWAGAYVYAVDTDFAAGGGFDLSETGNLIITDGSGNNVAENVAFVVFSRGPNQYAGNAGGGDRDSEDENNDGDGTFVNRTYSDNPGDIYDDVIDWMSANVLKAKLVEAGKLP
jgi:prepilin-type N-terminal cleavage/methylation domain-containing protein